MSHDSWKSVTVNGRNLSISRYGDVKMKHQVIIRSDGIKRTIHETLLKPSACKITGRKHVVINRKNFRVHYLVALAFLGVRPNGMVISHKDGDNQNNSIENIEYISKSLNTLNIADGIRSNNKSGVRGVCFNKRTGMWQSSITVEKTGYIKLFKEKADAVLWRKDMEVKYNADRRTA